MITYPRKCLDCSYIANNPAMFSCHKKTHQPIPQNEKCHFGCGNDAVHRNTNNKLTCNEKYQKCPAYLMQLAERTTKSWKGDDNRKQTTKKIFEEHVVFNKEARNKGLCAIKANAILLPEDAKNYRAYARKCRKMAQQWAKDNGYELGQQTYHVDHKLSILDGYAAGLSTEVVSHPKNLRVIPANENISKGSNSIISVEELCEQLHTGANDE